MRVAGSGCYNREGLNIVGGGWGFSQKRGTDLHGKDFLHGGSPDATACVVYELWLHGQWLFEYCGMSPYWLCEYM